MINEATKKNLRRKSEFVDQVQLVEDTPLFSWIDLSLTELCNRSAGHPRACSFCPRIDPAFYPNQNLQMSMELAEGIAEELKTLAYQGTVVLCGFGEPLLHPKVCSIADLFTCRVEVVTNGDFLGPQKVDDLLAAGVDYFVVSCYDGPHQIGHFTKVFDDAGIGPDYYILRDRWHSEADAFGLKLTNRGGTVDVGPQDPVVGNHPCYYLAYQMMVDWNGDVLLCPQDWTKKVKYGNLHENSLLDIWTSSRMNKRRQQLIKGQRALSPPCSNCNTDGTLHGFNHAPLWSKK